MRFLINQINFPTNFIIAINGKFQHVEFKRSVIDVIYSILYLLFYSICEKLWRN